MTWVFDHLLPSSISFAWLSHRAKLQPLQGSVLSSEVGHFVFHKVCLLPIIKRVKSDTGNVYPREPDLWMGKISLLRSSGRIDKLFLACSEKTEADDGSWYKTLPILALNWANYLEMDTWVAASWLCLQAFIDKVCIPMNPDRANHTNQKPISPLNWETIETH